MDRFIEINLIKNLLLTPRHNEPSWQASKLHKTQPRINRFCWLTRPAADLQDRDSHFQGAFLACFYQPAGYPLSLEIRMNHQASHFRPVPLQRVFLPDQRYNADYYITHFSYELNLLLQGSCIETVTNPLLNLF